MWEIVLTALVKIGILVFGLLTAVAYLVLLERRMAAWIQDRHGPNRVGIPLFDNIHLFGLGQPIADGVKFLLKEEYTPAHVDKFLFSLAPVLILGSAMAVFAVIPFGGTLVVAGHEIPLVVAPHMDVAILFIFALSGLAVYGVILGGWASNNKYSFLGGLRASAQLIAYEIPLGLGILGVVLQTGTLRLDEIVTQQAESGVWLVAVQPLGFLIFSIAALAEATRLPFDLVECEQELVGGFHTEYSGMRMACFAMAEFLHMITAAFLIVILFFGGWHVWGLPGGASELVGPAAAGLRVTVFLGKTLFVILIMMLIRWSWPRFRFDQLMSLAWKGAVPLGIVNLVLVALMVESRHGGWNVPQFVWIALMWVGGLGALGLAALWSARETRPAPVPNPGSLN